MMSTNISGADNKSIFYAHTVSGGPKIQWEPLEKHLEQVADRAAVFASTFGASEWGRAAGLWHDLGKYSPQFQQYLTANTDQEASSEQLPGKVDHSTAGAKYAMSKLAPPSGKLLAYAIAGHHAGLLNGGTRATADQPGNLEHRLHKTIAAIDMNGVPSEILAVPSLAPPSFKWMTGADGGFQLATFGRMLFSCLVDADFLETEAFCNTQLSQDRGAAVPHWASWAQRVDQMVQAKQQAGSQSTVNQQRARVYQDCLRCAEDKPGIFSLTVPTGGGKTLASFAFALRHAQRHGLNRIIYALPYTSIIEQNAQVFRDVLGPDDGAMVLEHHTNLDPKKETHWNRLASENWDAPSQRVAPSQGRGLKHLKPQQTQDAGLSAIAIADR